MTEYEEIAERCQRLVEEFVKCANETNIIQRAFGQCTIYSVKIRKCRTDLYLKQREEHNKKYLARFKKSPIVKQPE